MYPARLLLLLGAAVLGACTYLADSPVPQQELVVHNLLPAIIPAGQPMPSWGLQERMVRYGVPGVSIALIDDGKIAWAKGFGVTRANGAVAVSSSTLFQAASLVKVVTATGALRLVEEGKIALDEDVNHRLTRWKIPANEFTAQSPVTLRKLLSHSAGVTGHGFDGYAPGDALPSLLQILDGESPANSPPVRVDSIPGSAYRYSGGGYLIVQLLMEEASGQRFDDLLQQQVLDRAAMQDSTFRPSLPVDGGATAACGHGFDGAPVEDCGNVYPETAAAWLWSTPTDLARLGIMLAASLEGKPNAVLGQATAASMLARDPGDMGLGPGVHGAGDDLHFDHAGWNRGFRAYMVVYPVLGKGIVVMANADGARQLIDEIVRGAAHTYRWPDFAPQRRQLAALTPAELDAHAGDYAVRDRGFVISVRRQDDHLVVDTPRGSSYFFYPEASDRFFSMEDGSELTFSSGAGDTEPTLRVWGMVALRTTKG